MNNRAEIRFRAVIMDCNACGHKVETAVRRMPDVSKMHFSLARNLSDQARRRQCFWSDRQKAVRLRIQGCRAGAFVRPYHSHEGHNHAEHVASKSSVPVATS